MPFSVSYLQFNPEVFNYCKENICGNYKKNYMCPPLYKPVDISQYSTGYVFQYKCLKKNWKHGKIKFHKIIIDIESKLKKEFENIKVLSYIGGSCELCYPCEAVFNRKCKFPEKARPSLEAAGYNVIDLLKKLKLPYKFNEEIVLWTGAIIIKF